MTYDQLRDIFLKARKLHQGTACLEDYAQETYFEEMAEMAEKERKMAEEMAEKEHKMAEEMAEKEREMAEKERKMSEEMLRMAKE